MEFLKLNIIVIFIMASLFSLTENTGIVHVTSPLTVEGIAGESIIIDDDIIFISANNPITQVGLIHIGTGTKSTLPGSNQLNYSKDLSSYQTGDYMVDVTTTQGGFSGTITVTH